MVDTLAARLEALFASQPSGGRGTEIDWRQQFMAATSAARSAAREEAQELPTRQKPLSKLEQRYSLFDQWFSPLQLPSSSSPQPSPPSEKENNNQSVTNAERIRKEEAEQAIVTGLEKRFLAEIFDDIDRARFHPLSRNEEVYSTSQRYLFSAPMSISWSKFDKTLIKHAPKIDIYKTKATKPDSAESVLIFHRGVGVYVLLYSFIAFVF